MNPCPAENFVSASERLAAQIKLLGRDAPGPVVGYLGGLDERKGYKRLIASLAADPDCFLLIGGPHTDGFDIPALRGRFKALGLVHDTAEFYAACDVLAVPSYFDPCPLVVFEAAARGVPVVATQGVGNIKELLCYGAGAAWDGNGQIGPIGAQAWRGRGRVAAGDVADGRGAVARAIFAAVARGLWRSGGCKSKVGGTTARRAGEHLTFTRLDSCNGQTLPRASDAGFT